MSTTTGIIKKSRVKSAGRLRLSAGKADPDGDHAAVEANLLTSDDAGAVIEVVCPCGRRLEIACVYAAGASQTAPETPQQQDQTQQ